MALGPLTAGVGGRLLLKAWGPQGCCHPTPSTGPTGPGSWLGQKARATSRAQLGYLQVSVRGPLAASPSLHLQVLEERHSPEEAGLLTVGGGACTLSRGFHPPPGGSQENIWVEAVPGQKGRGLAVAVPFLRTPIGHALRASTGQVQVRSGAAPCLPTQGWSQRPQ